MTPAGETMALRWILKWLTWVFAVVMLGSAVPAFGIPAFARKYNLRCSDCHEAWPKLNNFGQTFKDNGYQLMTGRDSPIYQQPSYFPIMFRTIPVWNRESNNRVLTDIVPGNPSAGQTGIQGHDIRLQHLGTRRLDRWHSLQEHLVRGRTRPG